MKNSLYLSFVFIGPWITNLAWGYEVDTHEDMSQKAIEASIVFNNSVLLTDLGLKPIAKKQKFPNALGQARDITNLIRDGARFEDDFPRPLNHFYSPTTFVWRPMLCA